MNTRPILFFDCETGGLDAATSDMTQLGWVLTDPSGETVLREFEAKVFPEMPVSPEAAAVNGYTPNRWAEEAVPLQPVLAEMLTAAKGAVFAAHNAHFDWSYVTAAARRHGLKWAGDYHILDTSALMWPLLMSGAVEKVRLQNALDYFDIANPAAHTALADAHACRQVFLRLKRGWAT